MNTRNDIHQVRTQESFMELQLHSKYNCNYIQITKLHTLPVNGKS